MRERDDAILADLIAIRAEEKPDLDVVTFELGGVRDDEVRTYADLFENANRVAADLITKGMEPGERFAILIRNHPEFIEMMIAASISGCVYVPIDPRSRGEKLAYTIRNSGCRGIYCADYSLAQIAEIRDQVPDIKWISVLETGEEKGAMPTADMPGAENFAAVMASPFTAVNVRLKGPGDMLQIVYTSGTTGDPKGVVLSNERFGNIAKVGPWIGLTPDDRPYTGLSLTHGNAQMLTLAFALGMGLRAVFSRKFTKSRLWDIARKYGCTTFNLLGGMATAIYSEPKKPNDGDNPVRFVLSAGMPPTIWENFENRFNVDIVELYGAVEGGLAMKPAGVGPVGSFGKPPPNLEMKIVDEDDNDCPPGVMGELICRPNTGEDVKVEYFGNPEASAKKIAGGWLRSGDICHRDEDGWYFFDYRAGGGIRHNGDFINPGFVERAVAEHPQVTDVFVYGVPAASGAPGEKDVVAAIVAVDPNDFDPASVFARCKAELEANFVPTYLQVVDQIPKTASEKPQERFLLEKFSLDAEGVYTN